MEKLQHTSQLTRAESGKINSASNKLRAFIENKKVLVAVLIAVVVLAVLVCTLSFHGKTHRTELYASASGTGAGLQAVITYDLHCDKNPCKPTFDFNVYILNAANGQQVGVVRPDQDGKVDMALPEGNYIMFIGKQFGKDQLFPEEKIVLKNGKSLELKLHYE